jgi:uncharacterized protein
VALADVRKRRWFLPDTPDLVGALRAQLSITLEGLDAFSSWAAGDQEAGAKLIDTENRAEAAKRELLDGIREAFITPVEPEDLFALSRWIDRILDYARDLVRESGAMATPPDARLAEMAQLLREAVGHIDEAIGLLETDGNAATGAADSAIGAERGMERIYYEGMAALLAVEDRQARIALRELYRRCIRIGEMVVEVAERIVYSVVKQS